MIFSRLLSFAVPAFILLTPTHAALAQYQSLYETAESDAESGEPFAWAIRIDAGEPTLTGNVPYASVATILAERAGSNDQDMKIAAGAPLGFLRDAMKAIAASEVLAGGSIAYDEGQWTVSGTLAPNRDIAALTDVLGSSVGTGTEWIVAVETSRASQEQDDQSTDPVAPEVVESVENLLEENAAEGGNTTENAEAGASEPETLEPLESETAIAPQMAAQASDPADDAENTETDSEPEATLTDGPIVQNEPSAEQAIGPTDIDVADTEPSAEAALCREQISALTENNPISFASGRTAPTAASEEVITEIAGILAVCPSQPVYVEGHTDADGRAETNLVLSLSRAEAVVDRLVEQGIDPQRLFAVGYGANLPVASNDTAAGKAENRRIVFSFEDIAQ